MDDDVKEGEEQEEKGKSLKEWIEVWRVERDSEAVYNSLCPLGDCSSYLTESDVHDLWRAWKKVRKYKSDLTCEACDEHYFKYGAYGGNGTSDYVPFLQDLADVIILYWKIPISMCPNEDYGCPFSQMATCTHGKAWCSDARVSRAWPRHNPKRCRCPSYINGKSINVPFTKEERVLPIAVVDVCVWLQNGWDV